MNVKRAQRLLKQRMTLCKSMVWANHHLVTLTAHLVPHRLRILSLIEEHQNRVFIRSLPFVQCPNHQVSPRLSLRPSRSPDLQIATSGVIPRIADP
jgi:hypothetical protein